MSHTVDTSQPAPRGRTTSDERRVLWAMGAFVLLLHVLGWGVLGLVVAPQQLTAGTGQLFGLGLGLTAYTLGMRHAFDADHIAAIDNTTRRMLIDGKRPVSVGFWFSLGHSSVVFGLVVLLAIGVRALVGQLESDSSTLAQITGVVGTAVSGTFLMLIGIINLVSLIGIVRVYRGMRRGRIDEAELDRRLDERGVLNRLLRGVMKTVHSPRRMYPVGLLFGLGFDTATEIGLLVLAGGAAAFALPWYAIMTLPVLFAAGMSLFDTADGVAMRYAYGWAFARPSRKIFYNLTITSLSVAVALGIGGIELLSILTDKTGITSGPVAAVAGLDLNYAGFVIVGLFLLAWGVSVAVWKALGERTQTA